MKARVVHRGVSGSLSTVLHVTTEVPPQDRVDRKIELLAGRGPLSHGDLVVEANRRNALARSILAHAEGHERRAIREALAALGGASVDEIARARDED